MNDYNFGNFLCMLREQKGLTQADVAKELGVTPAAVSKWENGSSKPRVEILFRLAEILGVRSEELMAGHFLAAETLNPKIVQEINARYEYLIRVDSHNTANVKFRRALAWVIDWNIIGISTILLILIWFMIVPLTSLPGIIGMLILILLYPTTFIFRDVIFKDRSLGKRITRLVVLDKATGTLAKPGKRILRDLFLPIIHIDMIFLLATGSTIGDRVAQTVVVPEKALQLTRNAAINDISKINAYSTPRPTSKKKVVLLIVGIIVAFFALIFSITFIALSSQKDTEEYKVAYRYLVESETFQALNADESKIWMNRYSSSTYTSAESGAISRTVEFGFVVKTRAFHVVCHQINGEWQVCDECTLFE